MNWRVTVKRRGGEGHRVDKRGRDKRQRDGEARQIPIIYSAARSAQFALGFLRLRFPPPSETASRQFGIYASGQVPDSVTNTKRMGKRL